MGAPSVLLASTQTTSMTSFEVALAGVIADGVRVVVAVDEDHGGLREILVRTTKPFAFDDPAYPDQSTWPKNKIPLGWDSQGQTVWFDANPFAGKHTLIPGRTGAGRRFRVPAPGLRRCCHTRRCHLAR